MAPGPTSLPITLPTHLLSTAVSEYSIPFDTCALGPGYSLNLVWSSLPTCYLFSRNHLKSHFLPNFFPDPCSGIELFHLRSPSTLVGLVFQSQPPLLPTVVFIRVPLSPLWSQRLFEVGTVSDSSLCPSRFPGSNGVAWHSLAEQTINILRQSSSTMCWFSEPPVCVLAVNQGAGHRPQTQCRTHNICVGITPHTF